MERLSLPIIRKLKLAAASDSTNPHDRFPTAT